MEKCVWYWDNDQLCELYYLNANMNIHGDYKKWNCFGALTRHAIFVDGLLHGLNIEWDYSGKLYYRGYFVNGERHGEHVSSTLCCNSRMTSLYEYGVNIRLIKEPQTRCSQTPCLHTFV